MKNRTTHYFKPMLCGAWGCVRASVLAFLKQGSSLQQYLIAVVVETAEVYAKMAHNGLAMCSSGFETQNLKYRTNDDSRKNVE
jgi:hypothetical protein